MDVSLIYPHQLFRRQPALRPGAPVYLVEDQLFFTQYRFHVNKLILHRSSMKNYAALLVKKGYQVEYIDAVTDLSGTRELFDHLKKKDVKTVHIADPCDYLLERRLRRYAARTGIQLAVYTTPNFICSADYLKQYFDGRRKYFLAKFYEDQRRRLHVLMDGEQPAGGKWSFDEANRQKMPASEQAPALPSYRNPLNIEAREYVLRHFSDHYGAADAFNYPVTHAQADRALGAFLQERFEKFGVFQDAIVRKEHFLYHSILSSSLNTGLIDPAAVVEAAVKFAVSQKVPFNSLEGFVRQILGWREYIRGVYVREGVPQRTKNFFDFSRKLPGSFYTGKTGIDPVDAVVVKVMQTGYAHHIERLMIMGNFMLLCEIRPDDVYRWFMELFIDAYDWVMVPNVYGMSQFADGGLMSTKPYISSSNYILKMSDFKKGPWSETWDALFWRFMHVHRDVLSRNPRLSMLLATFDKMPAEKKNTLLDRAEKFLQDLDAGQMGSTLF